MSQVKTLPPRSAEEGIAAGPKESVAPRLESVKDLVVWRIDRGDGPGLFELFDSGMQRGGSAQATTSFVEGVLAAKGHWRSVVRKPEEASRGTWRVEAERGEWKLELAIDDQGKVSTLWVVEPPPPEPPVAQSPATLALPFRGEWLVGWGGDRLEVNHHLHAPSQRRAADLSIVGPNGKTYRTDGKSNADYLAFGQPILAVSDGTVITVVDGVPENVPGLMNGYMAPGNYVVVEHTPSLYSVYAHLQPSGIRVRVGDRVAPGSVLGLCGNSGNSSEPHLHFQLQDGPAFERSWGVEAVFEGVVRTRDGRTEVTSAYRFLKGDSVRAAD